jgi:hypothetical protein
MTPKPFEKGDPRFKPGDRVRLRASTSKGVVLPPTQSSVRVSWDNHGDDKSYPCDQQHPEMLIRSKSKGCRELQITFNQGDSELAHVSIISGTFKDDESIRVREVSKTPRKGKFVTKEMLSKAYNEVFGLCDAEMDSQTLEEFCVALGLTEKEARDGTA